MKRIAILCVSLLCAAADRLYAEDNLQRVVQPFLAKYCVDCHGSQDPEGDVGLEAIFKDPPGQQIKTLLKIQKVLSHEEMPPKDKPRPPASEIAAVQNWLEREFLKVASVERESGPRMVLRRLNRVEYNNSIRDLFGVDLKPAKIFPEDDSAHGFDNVGAALTVSPLLLEKYLTAAQYVTDRTIFEKRPETVKKRFPASELAGGSTFTHLKAADRLPPSGAVVFYSIGPTSQNSENTSPYPVAYPRPHFRPKVAGEYVFRTQAWGLGGGVSLNLAHKNYYGVKHLENFPQGDLDFAVIFKVYKADEFVERFHLTREPAVYETRVFAEQGQEFTYTFENGPPNVQVSDVEVLKQYTGPGMAIDWIEVEGPVYDQWPPTSHQSVFFEGPNATPDRGYAERTLRRFATRAYRRPAVNSEVEDLLKLFDARRREGNSFERSVAAAVELAICSPSSLYLVEPAVTPDRPRKLDDFEMASRLSYFLWSSMPDKELFQLASDGKLANNPAELETQVRRMLKDPKADAFTRNFVGQWLGLRKLHSVAVDSRIYTHHNAYLEWLMERETELFFEEILKHNLSVLNFIDSDFMMLNNRLAMHYGVEGVKGAEFRRVPVPKDGSRGGLTSQASILTLTTCGTRTSPVMRGVWVLDRILGYETPPPPKSVPALTPDTRGGSTIREQVALHRANSLCARCHNKIDPIGLALENYDVVGNWRDNYFIGTHKRDLKKGREVDASVTMTTGEKVTHPRELRTALLKQKERFCHSLVEKLMTYALGRGMGLADRQTMSELAAGMKDNDYKLSALIVEIVKSEPFRTR